MPKKPKAQARTEDRETRLPRVDIDFARAIYEAARKQAVNVVRRLNKTYERRRLGIRGLDITRDNHALDIFRQTCLYWALEPLDGRDYARYAAAARQEYESLIR